MFKKVSDVIDARVKPKLLEHYGDIQLISVEDGVVSVKLLGACSGCPSAKFTIEDVVLAGIREELPEITEVVLIQEVGQDLLDMAKKILNKEV